MATVKSIPRNNSSSFFVNDALPPGLSSFEITEESPPKSDFDIDLFLFDIEKCSKQQCFDDANWSSKTTDSQPSLVLAEVCSSSSTAKKESSAASLGALAADHFKEYDILNDLRFDSDFNLSDILSNDDYPRTNPKNTESCENINLFDFCVGLEVGSPSIKFTSEKHGPNDVSVDDLSDLVESSHIDISPCQISLETLATNHFLNNGPKSKSSDSVVLGLNPGDSDIQPLYSVDDILFEEKEKHANTEIEIEDLLSELCSNDNSETNNEKHETSEENSVGEIIPDVDLSFCIKRSTKDKFSSQIPSSESVDSGFDETGFLPFSIPSQNSVLCTDTLIPQIDNCLSEKEKFKKQSLLCRALSARPKIDVARKAKLKKVRKEMLSFPLSLTSCNKQENLHVPQMVVDNSNNCVIVSSFLKVSDKK